MAHLQHVRELRGEKPRTMQGPSASGISFDRRSDSPTPKHGTVLLTLSKAKVEDWAEFWPFPAFEPNRQSISTPVASNAAAMAQCAAPNVPRSPYSDGSSDDGGDACVALAEPHPLSSDWNLEFVPRPKSFATASPPPGGRSPLTASSLSTRPLSAASAATTHSSGLKGHSIRKAEVTSLLSVFDPMNPLGAGVNMAHIDLRWIARREGGKAIVTPSIHLHLGNISAALSSGCVRNKQVLINSPRSAIVLLRRGIALDELKRIPHDEQRALMAPSQLSWNDRKILAIEKVRQRRLQELILEYEEVCEHVTFDEIVTFCNSYNVAHPSSAMALPFGDETAVSSRIATSASYCSDKFDSLMSKYEKRENRIIHSKFLLQNMQEKERQQIVARIMQSTQRAASALESREAQCQTGAVISRGKRELWVAQRDRHEREEAYRRLITRDRLQRRLDEVACIQGGINETVALFQNSVRRLNVEGTARKEHDSSKFLKLARKKFLLQQF